MARWFRLTFGSLLARPFVCEYPMITAMLRFHIPLIKPNVQFSRIRLSDRISRVRPRKVTSPLPTPTDRDYTRIPFRGEAFWGCTRFSSLSHGLQSPFTLQVSQPWLAPSGRDPSPSPSQLGQSGTPPLPVPRNGVNAAFAARALLARALFNGLLTSVSRVPAALPGVPAVCKLGGQSFSGRPAPAAYLAAGSLYTS